MRILDPEKTADIEDIVSLRMYRGKVPDVKELWHTKCTNALAKVSESQDGDEEKVN